jgi:hypothetical protein
MRLQRRLIKLEIVPMESSADDQRQLHACEIQPDASPWAVAEGIETHSLSGCQVLLQPSVWPKLLNIVAPDLRTVVDRIAGYGQDRACVKEFVAVRDSLGQCDDSREADGGGGVQAHCFVDAAAEEGEILDMLKVGGVGVCWNGGIQFGAETRGNCARCFALCVQDLVEDSACSVRNSVAAGDQLGQGF